MRPTKKDRSDIAAEFDKYFGNYDNLSNWQRLCKDVGLAGDLPSVTQCRKALRGVWVNIYDLMDAVRADTTPPRLFPDRKALSKYTRRHKKFFPRELAKEYGPLKALLKPIA